MSNKHHAPHESHVDESPGGNAGQTPRGPGNGAQEPLAEAQAREQAANADKTSQDKAPQSSETDAKALRDQLSDLNDKYLRKLAEEANFRKRMVREREEGQRYALSGLLGDLVHILDDFDRAIASADTAKDFQILHDGVVLIRRQFGQMLENKYGLSRIETQGKPFDPNCHEAVAMSQVEPGAAAQVDQEPMVEEELLPGYRLHDRVLRPAKVRVSAAGRV